MTRIEDLKRKLAARRNKPGFEDNCRAIEEAIKREEAREAARNA